MGSAVELSYVHDIVFILQNCCFVVINVKIIRCAEDSHNARETSRPRFAVHPVTSVLGFVSANYRKKIVLLEKMTRCGVRKEEGATTNVVVNEELRSLLLTKLFERVSP